MLSLFRPAPHKARLPKEQIDPVYRRLRWQIFMGIFFGYAAYYLVRKNFALAMLTSLKRDSLKGIWVLLYQGSRLLTVSLSLSWGHSLTVLTRVTSYPQVLFLHPL